MNGILDSLIRNLIFVLILFAFLALVVQILTRRIAIALALTVLFCFLNPTLKREILATTYPWVSEILLMLVILFGFRVMFKGLKDNRKR